MPKRNLRVLQDIFRRENLMKAVHRSGPFATPKRRADSDGKLDDLLIDSDGPRPAHLTAPLRPSGQGAVVCSKIA